MLNSCVLKHQKNGLNNRTIHSVEIKLSREGKEVLETPWIKVSWIKGYSLIYLFLCHFLEIFRTLEMVPYVAYFTGVESGSRCNWKDC